MEDEKKNKKQLIEELNEMRRAMANFGSREEAFRKSEANLEKFTKAFLQSAIPISITTLKEGRFVEINNAFLALAGRSRDEVIGKTSVEIGCATEEQRQMVANELKKNGCIENLEFTIKTGKGEPLQGLFNCVMMTLADKKYLLTVMTDITCIKQAEKIQAESEERYRLFFENAIQGMFQSTLDGRYLNVNPAFARMHGFASPEEMINNVTDIAAQLYKYPAEREELKNIIFQQGVIKNYEVERLRKDGQVIWQLLNAHVVRDSEGNILMVEGTCIDITDRKRAEDALAKSEEKYRTIAENIMDCIVLEDAKGIFQYVINCREILGYEPEEMIGKTGLSFCHPDERAREINLYRGAVGKEWNEIIYETRIRHKNGHYVSIEVNTRTLRDEQGEFIGAVFAARDAAHHRRMVKELFHIPKSSSTSPILSLREKEIMGWVMQGKSTWDIATILDISERTVKFHIDSTMKKLSAVNRTHAVAIAMRHELIQFGLITFTLLYG